MNDTEKTFLNPNDFQSIQIDFDVTNTTTRTAFNKNFKIRLCQVGEKNLLIEAPRMSCAQGHSLSIKARIRNILPVESLEFMATCKVERVETFSQGGDAVLANLIQYDQKIWSRFNDIFLSRQKEIESFFKAARGH